MQEIIIGKFEMETARKIVLKYWGRMQTGVCLWCFFLFVFVLLMHRIIMSGQDFV